MAMTANGVSTTTELGTEQFEETEICGRRCVQYDYRHTNGRLFSCMKRTLEMCRVARDEWISKQK